MSARRVPSGSAAAVPPGSAVADTDPPQSGRSTAPAVTRGRGPSSPAGAAPDASAAPGGLQGEAWRKAARNARSVLNRQQRRRAGRYVRKGDRGAGEQFRAGMTRRMPLDAAAQPPPPPARRPPGGAA